jgi:flagellar basal-body rod protein FlgB
MIPRLSAWPREWRKGAANMDIFQLKLFQRLGERMGWLAARQTVLSQNIANSDTPQFTPRDLKPLEFGDHLAQVASVVPMRTSVMHLAGTKPAAGAFADQRTKHQYETTPVGNSVVLEEQMMAVTQTQSDYQLMTNLYRKQLDMIRMALGRGV